MKVKITKNFYKDVEKLDNIKIISAVEKIVLTIENVDSLHQIYWVNVKKLKGYNKYYRVRIWNYRLWFELQDNVVIFRRILPRKDIYKFFP